MRAVELWCDGSGTVSGMPGGWAYVLRLKKTDGTWVRKEGAGAASATTSQRMEITAMLMGLKALTRPCQVQVFGDSQYVMFAIQHKWLQKWEAREWRKVKNPDLWQEVVKLLKVHDIKTNWVRGHVGTDLNERCDVLAGEQRRLAIDSPDVFFSEPCGDQTAVQPSLLDPNDSSHLDAIASVA